MWKLSQDGVYAVRTFGKAPGFTAIAVLVLAFGIGANTAIFTVVNELRFRAKSGRAGELVAVHSHARSNADAYRGFSYPNYVDVRDRSGVFEALTAHTFCMVGTPAGGETRRTFASVVAANYFDTLGVSLAAGRTFTPDEERPGGRYGRRRRNVPGKPALPGASVAAVKGRLQYRFDVRQPGRVPARGGGARHGLAPADHAARARRDAGCRDCDLAHPSA